MPVQESPYHPAKKPLWARDKGFSACRKSLFRRTRHCFIQMRGTQYAGIQVIVSMCQNQRVGRQTACCLQIRDSQRLYVVRIVRFPPPYYVYSVFAKDISGAYHSTHLPLSHLILFCTCHADGWDMYGALRKRNGGKTEEWRYDIMKGSVVDSKRRDEQKHKPPSLEYKKKRVLDPNQSLERRSYI